MDFIRIWSQEKGTLKLCEKYSIISLISHSSKGRLHITTDRLKSKAEELWKDLQLESHH
ncbi:hypothetical protein DPMN_036565 [Dreissena polymorpha]|uniref:Uncharacterized protein n=1 Tax=Dreissena polymorpha TaxID=45954 RepID=A0A9D4RNY5_DREPO|nr:hypothetical protein DPMN_036565 [Dreissena polymorpha]